MRSFELDLVVTTALELRAGLVELLHLEYARSDNRVVPKAPEKEVVEGVSRYWEDHNDEHQVGLDIG